MFTNKAVAAKYKSAFGVDKKVTVQGLYSGMLSGITLEAADKMHAEGDNQLELITEEDKANKPQKGNAASGAQAGANAAQS